MEADDLSGIQRVVGVYTYDDGYWHSLDLAYDTDTQKWVGLIPAWHSFTWLVQVVDGADNVTVVNQNGALFRANLASQPQMIFIPVVARN